MSSDSNLIRDAGKFSMRKSFMRRTRTGQWILLLFLPLICGLTISCSPGSGCATGAGCNFVSRSPAQPTYPSPTNATPSTPLVAGAPASAQTNPPGPVLFFSDLESGPKSGNTDTSLGQTPGQDGAIVSIWGVRLGNSRGSSQVLYNDVPVSHTYFWGPSKLEGRQKVVFQIGHGADNGAGQITVLVNGVKSNALPFFVRPGTIHFVAPGGKDSNHGSFSSPWKSVIKARNSMHPGDITYAMDGLRQATEDGEGWDAAFTLRSQWCTASGYPRSLVAYPGAHVIIGNPNGNKPAVGIRSTDPSGWPCNGHWTFAGLELRGIAPVAINGPSRQWRFVGNDITCPNAGGFDGGGACFLTSKASEIKFYGNLVHEAGTNGASALFQGVYFSTDSNHLDVGWNAIYNIHGCRGIQIHSTPLGDNDLQSGQNIYDLSIHDNLIHDTQCDGIILDTIDPSKGPVLVYNNVIYNAGKGPNNPEHTGGWSCINVAGKTEKGSPGSGTVEIYNNTLYACGTFAEPPYSSANAGVMFSGNVNLYVQLRNNIIEQIPTSLFPSGVPYVVIWNPRARNGGTVCHKGDNCPWMKGVNNLFYGSGPLVTNLSNFTKSIYGDPQFVNLSEFDFHLAASSPAGRAGTPTPLKADQDGVLFPQDGAYPIGAFASNPR